ncbi:MAG: DNA-directed RNA polymerase subunit K [Candidatus Micrarchaeota archaeon]|nr:DNA-directed RNA polymerase subunit K [Candidatus Micrarchaeota archaeon]
MKILQNRNKDGGFVATQLSRFELARIIGARATQLSYGAPPLVEVKPGQTSIEVAKAELEAGVIPLVVIRQ